MCDSWWHHPVCCFQQSRCLFFVECKRAGAFMEWISNVSSAVKRIKQRKKFLKNTEYVCVMCLQLTLISSASCCLKKCKKQVNKTMDTWLIHRQPPKGTTCQQQPQCKPPTPLLTSRRTVTLLCYLITSLALRSMLNVQQSTEELERRFKGLKVVGSSATKTKDCSLHGTTTQRQLYSPLLNQSLWGFEESKIHVFIVRMPRFNV